MRDKAQNCSVGGLYFVGQRLGMLMVLLFVSAWISIAQAQTVEICNDGIDNDGNGQVDCADSFCNFAANVEKGCRCFDNIDNDGDGKIDAADTDCATYYGLTFVGAGSTCSITPPGGNPFTSIAPPQTSSQNTADTPAKIVVGDMNNDGIPDAVTTSKWNQTLRVVATATVSGFTPGDVMGDYKTTSPGSIFPNPKSQFYFEHEILIGDINRDKIGDIFAIVSKRGGGPNTVPSEYYLVGFRYNPGTLVPLFNPVFLGNSRPGSPGIADFDGDGKSEIYLKNRIYAAESGVLLADGGGNWRTEINGGPVAANIIGDSKLELICGNFIYTVPSLAARTLQVMTVAANYNTLAPAAQKYYPKGFLDTSEYGKDHASTTSTADFDGDGFLDVLFTGAINCSGNEAAPCGNNITTIFYWNVQKNTFQTFAPPDAVTPATGWAFGTGRINMGDANGDGKLEALFVAGSKIFCLGLDGGGNLTVLWTRNINDSLSGILSLTVYDFDNDGKPEVVYRDSQELAIIDGLTGATKRWSAPCNSHTWTEGPVIADVNGDGGTDICVTCYTSNAFNINNATVQQQSLGQTRLYFSSTQQWLPTRKVWNQHPYYVTNINDNLTLPFPQVDPSLVFSNAPCPNGLPGPQRPLNLFMNQVPRLSASGCPEFPAPDLAFTGDDPANPGVDSDGDGIYTPAVVVTPPICGDIAIKAFFNIINSGSLPISDVVPVSFFNGDPTINPATAVRLHNTTITITNLQVGAKLVTPQITFNGPGTTFPLFIVLYNDGATLPITLTGQSTKECTISNNIYSVLVTPDPFTVTVEKVSDNIKCGPNVPPYSGEIRARIFKGAVEVVDYSPYSFQWYDGTGTATPHNPGGNTYHLTSVIDGDYTVVVTNTAKGCMSPPITGTVGLSQINPAITLNVTSNQTICSPPNGSIDASIAGGNVGYTFDWYDIALTPLGISGPTATNLPAGNYVVVVNKNGCSTTSAPATINGPVIPDAQATVLANVVDCLTPGSGSVMAEAVIAGVVQNPAGYTFNWYFYNNGTSTRGSILPPANGTGPTRTGLAVGFYQAEITDNLTQCVANQSPIVEVTSQIIVPTVVISEVSPQTSCDPLNPNGVLTAVATGAGLVSPNDYTFEWFKGDNTLPANLHTNVSGVRGETANSVSGGGVFYTVRVTTANNCSATDKLIITEDINQPVVALLASPNSICDETLATSSYNGNVTATVTFDGNLVAPGDPLYSYSWHKGSLITDPAPSPNSATNVLSQQNGGDYTLVVERTDLFCLSAPQTAMVINSAIPPVITAVPVPSTNCPGGAPNGQISANIAGITAGYTFNWYQGNLVSDPPVPPANGGNTPTVTGLQGGSNYTVEVLNTADGCINSDVVALADAQEVPILTLTSTDNSICDVVKGFNGTASQNSLTDVNAIGGDTYTFVWSTGADMTSPIGGQTASVLPGRDGGFYTATVTNTRLNCVSNPVTVQILNNQVLPAISVVQVPSTNCDPLLANGQITSSVTNGVLGETFAFQWHAGSLITDPQVPAVPNQGNTAAIVQMQGGFNYTVNVYNNVTGCANTHTETLADAQEVPILTLTSTDNSICDVVKGFNGTASQNSLTDVNAIGGDTYTFVWSTGADMTSPIGGQTASVLPGRDGGFYTATVTNTRLNCVSNPVTVQILNNQVLPAISVVQVPSTNCDPLLANGQITSSVTNGVLGETFAFQWHAGSLITDPQVPAVPNQGNTAAIVQMQGGFNYTVNVYNNVTGCANTHTETLADAQEVPILTLTSTDNSICDVVKGFNGTASQNSLTDVNAIGGDTYTFVWSTGADMTSPIGGQTASVLPGRDGGFYTATVTNTRLNCVSNPVTVQILNNQVLPAISVVQVPSTNCDPLLANGQITSSVTNGVLGETFAFQWHAGSLITDPQVPAVPNQGNTAAIVQMQGGLNYTVNVYNNVTGCVNTHTETLADISAPPTFNIVATPNSICDITKAISGAFDGTVEAFVNTIGNYAGSVAGDFTYTFNPIPGTAVVSGSQLLQLDVGFYDVTALHTSTGCTSITYTSEVTSIKENPVITTISTGSQNCPGGTPDGIVQVTAVSPPLKTYDYKWYDGNIPAGPVMDTDAIYSGVQGGLNGASQISYTVDVTILETGCANTKIVGVSDDSEPPLISALNFTNNEFCVGSNGTASIPVNGLTYRGAIQAAPYAGFTLNWSAGTPGPVGTVTTLAAGAYTLLVTNIDDNCTSNPVQVNISDNLYYPVINIAEIPQTSCDPLAPNGKLAASVNENVVGGPGGGAAVTDAAQYSFVWENRGDPYGPPVLPAPVTDPLLADDNGIHQLVESIFYEVTVTRTSTGCVNKASRRLGQSIIDPLLNIAGILPQNSCATPDGEATANVTTPALTTTFTYFWLRELPLQTTNDKQVVKATVDANLGPGFYNRKGTVAATTFTYGGANPPGMVNGRYTVVVEDDFTKCISEPVSVDIGDNTQANITLNIGALPSDCAQLGSLEISAVSTNGSADFDFDVFQGGPTNPIVPIDYYSNPANPPQFASAIPVTTLSNVLSGVPQTTAQILPSDIYTIVALDEFGCRNHQSFFLPFADAHGVNEVVTNVTNCTTENGAIALRATFPTSGVGISNNQSDYTYTFYSGGVALAANEVDVIVPGSTFTGPYGAETNPGSWPQVPAAPKEFCNNGVDDDGDGKPDATDEDCIGSITAANLPVGFYLLEIQDNLTLCKVYESVEIKQDARPAIVDLVGSVTANTSCNLALSDGSVSISITKDPGDNVVGVNYSVAVVPAPMIGAYPIAVGQFPIANQTVNGLRPDVPLYTITVTSDNGCETTQTISIPDQPVVGQLVSGDVVFFDAEYCDANLEQSAKITINDVKLPGGASEDLRDYHFEWYDDAALGTLIFDADGDTNPIAGGDELINQVPNPINGTVPVGTVTVGDYYVRAVKFQDVFSGSGGVGCTTAPFTINIQNNSVIPLITLTPLANTSCDAAFFEGSIEVDMITSSGPGSVGPTYDYTWLVRVPGPLDIPVTGLPGQPPNVLAQTGVNNNFPDIQDGTYTLNAENTITGCLSSLQTTLLRDTPPVFALTAASTNLTVCAPLPFNGTGTVNSVSIDGIAEGLVTTNFDYVWYSNDPNTVPVLDGTLVAPNEQLTVANYPTIALGPYFVKAVRKANPGAIGAGCESIPARIDILDNRVFPQITLSTVASTSCDPAQFDGRIDVTASTTGFGAGTVYNFDWTSNPGGTVVITDAMVVSPAVFRSEALGGPAGERIGPGAYAITVTNTVNQCFITGSATLLQNIVPIEVVTAGSLPLTHCTLPDGSVNVTAVEVAGAPLALPGNFSFGWTGPGGPYAGTNVNGLSNGDYFVTATKTSITAPGSGCQSAPFKVTVNDARQFPVISFAPTASTSCDPAQFDGRIDVTASTTSFGAGTVYNFDWTSNPGGTVVITDAMVVSPAVFRSEALGGPAGERIGPGAYAITVTNTVNQCFITGSATLLQNIVPVEVVTAGSLPLTHCTLPDGSVNVTAVEVAGAPLALPGNFSFGWTGPGGPYAGTNVNGLSNGDYFVTATKTSITAPGSGCQSAPFKVTVNDARQFPVISFAPTASTSCDPAQFDGRIDVTASTTSFGAGTVYNFDWTSNPGGTVVITDAMVVSPAVFRSEALGGPAGERIGPGAYAITVTNTVNQCFITGSATLLQNIVPIEVVTAGSLPLTHCTLPDGSVNVTAVEVAGAPLALPGNFSFGWTGPGGPYAGTNVNGLSNGDYFVTATKTSITAPGSGCQSAPFKVTVNDARQFPVISFAPTASTSCDPAQFDGRIDVSASTTGFGAGTVYNFDWTSNPGGTVVITDAMVVSPAVFRSEALGGPAGERIGPGAYAITVTNTANTCFITGNVTLLSNPQPVDILTVNKTDQLICYADGSITVTTLNSGASGDYSYQWFKDDPTSAPLQDSFAATINGPMLLPGVAAMQYPLMGSGTFYVRATKNAVAAPGAGCVTPPFRVDVQDLHTNPVIQLSYTPNSSCDPVNPNGIVLANAAEQGGANGDTYTFAWTLNASPLPPVTTQVDTNNSSQLDDAFDGSYILQVVNFSGTGCTATAGINVIRNLNISLPNIVDTNTIDPLDCLNSGEAEVTGISIGGGPTITGVALATDFEYEWYNATFPGGLNAVITPAYNNIGPGTYFVVVKDLATQCKSGPTQVEILDDDIVYPVVNIVQTAQQISCVAGSGTAALLATADGQTDTNPNYTFDWFENLTTTLPVFATTSAISNIETGDYSLLVRNVTTNCTATAVYIIPNDAPLFIPVISVGGQPRTFCVGQDGSFLARVTNLTPLYPFPLNFTSDLYVGANPNMLNPPDFPNMAPVPGFVANFLQSGLPNGTYTVRVTDNNTGCVVTKSGDVLDQRANPVVAIVEDNPMINCDPAIANGQLSASADGGQVGGYTFDWFAGTTVPSPVAGLIVSDNKLIGQVAGNYVVLVTNNISGCFNSLSSAITDGTIIPPVPMPTVVFDRTDCINPDGWVTVTVGGETLNYTFNWTDGTSASTIPDFTGVDYRDLDIGPYTVRATDVTTGCVSPPGTVDVLDKRIKPEFVLASTPSLCADTGRPATGSLMLTLTTPDVAVDNVIWTDVATNGNAGEGAQVFGVYPGLYHAFVTTSKGCTNEGDVLVETEIGPFNGVSDNGGDGLNDVFIIDCISNFPNNNVKIFNRAGIMVYEGDHYDNAEVSFKGVGERGVYLQGSRLPEGTYFYIIDKGDGSKPLSGYLELTR